MKAKCVLFSSFIRRWINLEADPEIVAAEESYLASEISEEFDSRLSMAVSMDIDKSDNSLPPLEINAEKYRHSRRNRKYPVQHRI